MMQGISLQEKCGDQTEIKGEFCQSFSVGAQLQHDGVRGLVYEGVLHATGKAVLAGCIDLTLCFDLAIHHLTAVGEEDRCVVAPKGGVCLPNMLHAVALAQNALDLSTPGGDGYFQVFVFNSKFFCHSCSLPFIDKNIKAYPRRKIN